MAECMVERKGMQLKGAVEMGNNEFKPRFCPCAPGGLPCTIQGVGRKVKIIPACKGNLEAMTYFNLPSPHSQALHVLDFRRSCRACRSPCCSAPPPPPPLPPLSSLLSPRRGLLPPGSRKKRKRRRVAVESNNKFEGTLFLAPCFLARPNSLFTDCCFQAGGLVIYAFDKLNAIPPSLSMFSVYFKLFSSSSLMGDCSAGFLKITEFILFCVYCCMLRIYFRIFGQIYGMCMFFLSFFCFSFSFSFFF